MLEYIKIYPGTKDLVKRFPAQDRCLLYEAVMDYAFGGQLPDWPQDDLKWLAWDLLKAKVDSAEKAKENGKKGGYHMHGNQQQAPTPPLQPTYNTPATPVQPAHDTPSSNIDIDIDIDKDIDIESDKGRKRTRTKTVALDPPSVEDVRAYCHEKGLQVDADKFVAHYTANGWKVGRNPMKDWHAACRTWVRNGYDTPKQARPIAQTDYHQREYEERPVGELPAFVREMIEEANAG